MSTCRHRERLNDHYVSSVASYSQQFTAKINEEIIQLDKDLPETELARALLTTVRHPLVILDGQMQIKWANASFYTNFRLKPEETEGRLIYEIAEGQGKIGKVRELFDKVTQARDRVTGHKVVHHFKGVGRRTLNMNGSTVFSESGDPQLIVLSIEDITERASKGEDRERLLKQVR
jgi:PAS domain S-box-containing protein